MSHTLPTILSYVLNTPLLYIVLGTFTAAIGIELRIVLTRRSPTRLGVLPQLIFPPLLAVILGSRPGQTAWTPWVIGFALCTWLLFIAAVLIMSLLGRR